MARPRETVSRVIGMRVLITGAAGRVGRATVQAAVESGHDVVACDVHYRDDLPVRLHVVDLLDQLPLYQLINGCDAVIHLANHPNADTLPNPAQLFTENTQMTGNVLWTARELGIQRMVFVSSIQAVIRRHTPLPPRRRGREDWGSLHVDGPKTLPISGRSPCAPGHNPYAQSKVAGEKVLEGLVEGWPELRALTVRLPMVLRDHSIDWMSGRRSLSPKDAIDTVTYIRIQDAAALLVAGVEHTPAGYHCTLPGQTIQFGAMSLEDLAKHVLPSASVEGPLDAAYGGLIDCREAHEMLHWRPSHEPVVLQHSDG